MTKLNFDLEAAVNELESATKLLSIFKELVVAECPDFTLSTDDANYDFAAKAFSSRTEYFLTLVDTAQDKIVDLCKQMDNAIEAHFCVDTVKGGEAV